MEFPQNSPGNERDFSFWKSLALMVVFFALTPLTLATSLFSLISFSEAKVSENFLNEIGQEIPLITQSGVQVYASLPSDNPELTGSVGTSDARPEIIRQYMESWGSPLVSYSSFIVETADKYGLDYRLTVAIAQKESNLCKIIPLDTYNCWGWGIHSKGTLGFSSYEEGIETVSRGLKEEYIDKGYVTTEEIMGKYTPLSNGSWAEGVTSFMTEME